MLVSCQKVLLIKRQLSVHQHQLSEAPLGLTQVVHRLRVMREITQQAVDYELDAMLVMRRITCYQKHWPTL